MYEYAVFVLCFALELELWCGMGQEGSTTMTAFWLQAGWEEISLRVGAGSRQARIVSNHNIHDAVNFSYLCIVHKFRDRLRLLVTTG